MILMFIVLAMTVNIRTEDDDESLQDQLEGRPIDMLFEKVLWKYERSVRPVHDPKDKLNISFGVSLIHLIDIDEKHQIVTTNLWLDMIWYDKKFQWKPLEYDNITRIHVPSTKIWVPDIVLHNNAAGNPQITFQTDVMVDHLGKVEWKPPAIYKSFCSVDVMWFPYDEQTCDLKFDVWTHSGAYVDLRFHADQKLRLRKPRPDEDEENDIVVSESGMDLSYFYRSAEWDILGNEAERHEEMYSGCCGVEKYVDITFRLHFRRRTLFYTVNLIMPCVLISFLTVFVFYLPSGSKQKIVLCISIFVTLSVFFLLLFDIMPATSLNTPMIGKYLLFDMLLCSASIAMTIITLNMHYNRPEASERHINPYIKKFFFEFLAPVLSVKRPVDHTNELFESNVYQVPKILAPCSPLPALTQRRVAFADDKRQKPTVPIRRSKQEIGDLLYHSEIIQRTLSNINYISNYYKRMARREELARDWSYLALVVDRLCLWMFAIATILGTCIIILQAPTLYDGKQPVVLPKPNKPLGYANM